MPVGEIEFRLKTSAGLNFINILREAFAPVGPKSVKIKAVRKYVGEIEPQDVQEL